MASDEKKVLTFDEVSNHNKTKDCWLIISGKVYDVTPFMDDHPGGDEVLLSSTGKDATNDFEDVGHSDTARDMMKQYYIGEIDSSTVPAKRTYVPPQQAAYNQDKTQDFVIKILQFLVPILILGLALVVRQYTKKE
ncbi:PREDICTED: cytochrome b5 [Tarenaya hassleriana]|uniref:cytochrome b5 n=1 Tax=Tarenaya hassleriana TaxID=28532 RepID=UPI00053C4681|nr:PREDICTED: cytochrome b5 [Tarenaya hassleriana]XP_010520943.1 PREDICTED: cytochrome b5 [Tarenaya hassleriana]